MQAANALKQKRLRDQQKKVPFTVPDLSKVGNVPLNWGGISIIKNFDNIKLICMVSLGKP